MSAKKSSTSTPSRPAYRLYQICPRGEGRSAYWREIGVGFLNQDSSVNLVFEAMPVDFSRTTVQLRPVEENREADQS